MRGGCGGEDRRILERVIAQPLELPLLIRRFRAGNQPDRGSELIAFSDDLGGV